MIGSEDHFIIALRTTPNSDGVAYPIAEYNPIRVVIIKGRPYSMIQEMCDSYKRSESLSDLERTKEDPITNQKNQIQNPIQQTTSEQISAVQEMFQKLSIGKIYQASA